MPGTGGSEGNSPGDGNGGRGPPAPTAAGNNDKCVLWVVCGGNCFFVGFVALVVFGKQLDDQPLGEPSPRPSLRGGCWAVRSPQGTGFQALFLQPIQGLRSLCQGFNVGGGGL